MISNEAEKPVHWLADEIGDEFHYWKPGVPIYIKAPTGSGKTSFVLHKLVGWIMGDQLGKNVQHVKKSILYLVNRRVLREQIMREIDELSIYYHANGRFNFDELITVSSYQEMARIARSRKPTPATQHSVLIRHPKADASLSKLP